MTSATGEFSIAALSQVGIEPTRSNTALRSRPTEFMTTQVKPLEFDFGFGGLTVALEGSGHEPSTLWRLFSSVKQLSALEHNWNSYGAIPVSATAVRRMVSNLAGLLLDDVPEPDLIPTGDGGVQLEWHRNGVDVEVKFPPLEPITYYVLVAADDLEVEREGIPDREILRDAFARMMPAA